LQWPPILNLQQSAQASTRKVWYSIEVLLSEMWCGVYTNNGTEWPFGT
jgi:hypothetical protein